MAINDVTRCAIGGRYGDDPFVFVLYYRTTSSIGPKSQELWGLIDALEETLFYKQLTNDLLDLCHPSVSFNSISLRDVVDKSIGLNNLIYPPEVGKMSGDALPHQSAVLVRKATAKVGRSYQGRIYLPGAAESAQNNGVLADWYLDDVASWLGLLTGIVNAGLTFAFQMVVYSTKLETFEDVTALGVDYKIRTQRRRAG